MKLRVVIGYADVLPPWYGIAYRLHNSMKVVCYPVPLHLIVGWTRWAWWTLAGMYSLSDVEEWNERAFEKGRQQGWEDATKHFREHGTIVQKAVIEAMLNEQINRRTLRR